MSRLEACGKNTDGEENKTVIIHENENGLIDAYVSNTGNESYRRIGISEDGKVYVTEQQGDVLFLGEATLENAKELGDKLRKIANDGRIEGAELKEVENIIASSSEAVNQKSPLKATIRSTAMEIDGFSSRKPEGIQR